jgi:exo-beta-1,3-glucanase (GH17 family)/cellulose synthase/poly-beta-1,6-N-acetylglucosamine synthase-like glycosyltransferase
MRFLREQTARQMNLFIWLAVATLTFAFFAFLGRAIEAPDWDERVRGVSYSPYGRAQSPIRDIHPSKEDIRRDLALLAEKTKTLRTYGARQAQDSVIAVAQEMGFRVTAGAWISGDAHADRAEVDRLIAQAQTHDVIERVIVGNEALLRNEVDVDYLAELLRYVRANVSVPVSTAEPWHIWVKYPQLAEEVDFLAAHMLPYWEGVTLESSVAYVEDKFDRLRETHPGKHIVAAEVGWPREGRIRKGAVPSAANASGFLREFLALAHRDSLDYFIIEAFDQPWKASLEGGVGAYWGLFDANRVQQVEFTGAVSLLKNWSILALLTIITAAPVLWFLFWRLGQLDVVGRVVLALIIHVLAFALIWILHKHNQLYWSASLAGALAILLPAILLLLGTLVVESVEFVESLWRAPLRALEPHARRRRTRNEPRVSIHVATYNEPPEMVIETLNAMARLDYANFEVILIDNNTTDPAVWRPVEDHCSALGEKFRFFHFDQLDGFKAGALNFALGETDPTVEIIAVVDSDYQVKSDWLSALIPEFEDPKIAIVQAPQDYRDQGESLFKRICYWEYAGFFHIGMVQRNERNAIIQHGTMTMVRKSVLEDVGAWGEWCICEDAELGLRVFEAGYEAAYTAESYGRGVMPDAFDAYRKQRFRWAYGAMQIMKRHWSELFAFRKTSLTGAQRYSFVAGWMGWFADGLNLIFTGMSILWTIGLLLWPSVIDYPLSIYLTLTLSFFAFKVVKSTVLYPFRVRTSVLDTLGAVVGGLALSYTVGKAVWYGVFTTKMPFYRTPKCDGKAPIAHAIKSTLQEGFIALALILAGAGVAIARGDLEPESWLWSGLLWLQSIPYLTAVGLSLMSAMEDRPVAPISETAATAPAIAS